MKCLRKTVLSMALLLQKNNGKIPCTEVERGAVKMPISSVDEGGLRLYHSHTNDTPHSATDLKQLLNEKVEEVGVVTRNGDGFTVSVGDGWIPTKEEFEDTVKRIADEVNRDLLDDSNFFELKIEERNYVAIREQTYRICREFKWELQGGSLYGPQ